MEVIPNESDLKIIIDNHIKHNNYKQLQHTLAHNARELMTGSYIKKKIIESFDYKDTKILDILCKYMIIKHNMTYKTLSDDCEFENYSLCSDKVEFIKYVSDNVPITKEESLWWAMGTFSLEIMQWIAVRYKWISDIQMLNKLKHNYVSNDWPSDCDQVRWINQMIQNL